MNKLYKRYLFREFASTVIFFLLSFYTLYIVIDAMAHIDLIAKHPQASLWLSFYTASFFKRLDILLPFAVALSSCRVCNKMQQNGEIVALLASGISKKALLRPLVLVTLLFITTVFFSYEWGLPRAITFIDHVEAHTFHKTKKSDPLPGLNEIMLDDNSKLVFSDFDIEKKEFYNIFWIRSANKIYYIKKLDFSTKYPTGYYVEHILRNPSQVLEKVSSFEKWEFKTLKIDENTVKNSLVPLSKQKLSNLFSQFQLYVTSNSPKASSIKAYLFHKALFPFLSFFALLYPCYFFLQFRRSQPILLVSLFTLSLLFGYSLLLHAGYVLARFQVLLPSVAIFTPWLLLSGYTFTQHRKL